MTEGREERRKEEEEQEEEGTFRLIAKLGMESA